MQTIHPLRGGDSVAYRVSPKSLKAQAPAHHVLYVPGLGETLRRPDEELDSVYGKMIERIGNTAHVFGSVMTWVGSPEVDQASKDLPAMTAECALEAAELSGYPPSISIIANSLGALSVERIVAELVSQNRPPISVTYLNAVGSHVLVGGGLNAEEVNSLVGRFLEKEPTDDELIEAYRKARGGLYVQRLLGASDLVKSLIKQVAQTNIGHLVEVAGPADVQFVAMEQDKVFPIDEVVRAHESLTKSDVQPRLRLSTLPGIHTGLAVQPWLERIVDLALN